jgi:hypothetical protein
MGAAQKIGLWVVGLAMLTTVSLPDRVFHKVLEAGFNGSAKVLGTAMGTVKG